MSCVFFQLHNVLKPTCSETTNTHMNVAESWPLGFCPPFVRLKILFAFESRVFEANLDFRMHVQKVKKKKCLL